MSVYLGITIEVWSGSHLAGRTLAQKVSTFRIADGVAGDDTDKDINELVEGAADAARSTVAAFLAATPDPEP